jgi:hypothetical protein
MNLVIDKAITLMNKLMQEVDNGHLELSPSSWDKLNKRLDDGRHLLNKSKVTERNLEQAARSVISAFEKTPVLAQHFAVILNTQPDSKIKDTAGRLRKQQSSLTDVQPFENQVVELCKLNEQIETKAQQSRNSHQQ